MEQNLEENINNENNDEIGGSKMRPKTKKKGRGIWLWATLLVIIVIGGGVFWFINQESTIKFENTGPDFREVLASGEPYECQTSSQVITERVTEQAQVLTVGETVRVDRDNPGQGRVRILREGAYYTSLPDGNGRTHFETGEECDWLRAVYEPGSQDDPNSEGRLLYNLRNLERDEYSCNQAGFGEEVFETPGTVCSFVRTE